jgi:deoxycytidylate deaminase
MGRESLLRDKNVMTSVEQQRPELIFSMVGPLGTRLSALSQRLTRELQAFGYEVERIGISELLARFPEWTPPDTPGEAARVRHFQTIANAIRGRLEDGAILARAAIAEIRDRRFKRSGNPDSPAQNCAFVIDQLKHPDEARLLRMTYGDALYIVGGHACWDKRVEEFAQKLARSIDQPGRYKDFQGAATELIQADDRNKLPFGQNMRDTYPHADIFIDLNPIGGESDINRFVDLIFGHPFRTPTPEEFAMYSASAVALRSSDENRQVGAAIVDISWEGPKRQPNSVRKADIRALGMNEVPRAGGGFYWDAQSPDARDQALLPEDRAQDIKVGMLAELMGHVRARKWLGPEAGNGDDSELARKLLPHLKGSQLMDIAEFSRPVHAEMAAIIDAARRGVNIDGCSMYVTTFPCHNCAKHIIAAGIRRVVYLEPYPKSRADDLYHEEVDSDAPSDAEYKDKVLFSAYSGVAPRQYLKLFSMSLRGRKLGPGRIKWEETRRSQRPIYVADHLQQGYVLAEQTALALLGKSGYRWDPEHLGPSDAKPMPKIP